MSLLTNCPSSKLCVITQAALVTSKYHLALSIMRKVTKDTMLRAANVARKRNLLHMLALYARAEGQSDLQLRVS